MLWACKHILTALMCLPFHQSDVLVFELVQLCELFATIYAPLERVCRL